MHEGSRLVVSVAHAVSASVSLTCSSESKGERVSRPYLLWSETRASSGRFPVRLATPIVALHHDAQ